MDNSSLNTSFYNSNKNMEQLVVGEYNCPANLKSWPIFSCAHLCSQAKAYFCTMEKIILLTNLLALILITKQVKIYFRDYKLTWKDLRVVIYCICISNAIYTIIHYGVIPPGKRGSFYFFFEFFRFLELCCICYYYSKKASGLIPKLSQVYLLRFMKIMIILSLPLYGIIMAII